MIHFCQANSNFFLIKKGWEGGKVQCTVTLFGKKQKLNHVMSVKTDTLNDNLCPGFYSV